MTYRWLEGLAERFLRWRGRVVLPRVFIGAAFGNCTAIRTGEWEYVVFLNGPGPVVIAMTNTVIRDTRSETIQEMVHG